MFDDTDVTNTEWTTPPWQSAWREEKQLRSKTQWQSRFSDRAHLSEAKCEELRIPPAKTDLQFEPVAVNDKPLEIVEPFELLGLNLSSDLKWNHHVSEIPKRQPLGFTF